VNPGGVAAQAGTTGTANPGGATGTNVSLAAWSVQADGGGACSADRAPRREPVGIARVRAADGHLTFTMTFKAALWPAGSELYIANGPLGPQMAVIPQGHYQGCA
jgi:hypothetical protein